MNGEDIQEKKPDEIYCPSCARPIKKDAVVCPHCGVQVKELKVSAEVRAMAPEEELEEGRRQLGGVKVFYWFVIVVLAFYLVVFVPVFITSPQSMGTYIGSYSLSGVITLVFVFGIGMAIYIAPLVGIIKRKPFSVPFTRVILIITMFGFPIGTIIGATLWKRINHPLAKKYLHYGV
ncbi:MAG: hypothetical protein JW983_00170 [Elusimicrobia bacterium]|nr:hypothetical protein [Elusimicrobiota bacterium]